MSDALFELVSCDRQSADQKEEGRFHDIEEAKQTMWKRKGTQPKRAFYIFIRISRDCRILSGHSVF